MILKRIILIFNWASKWSDVIGQTDTRGDTHKIYKAVWSLISKRGKSYPNLTVNSQGETLKCVNEVDEEWGIFFGNKIHSHRCRSQ